MRFASISRYLHGCLAFQSGNYLGSHFVGVENPMHARMHEFVTKVLNALPTPENTVIHAEVFHTPDDRLVFCEIASRAGGTRILETVRRAYGINLVKTAVQVQGGRDVPAENVTDLELLEYTGFLLLPPREGTFVQSSVTAPAPWVVEYLVHAKPGQTFGQAKLSVEHMASMIVSGDTEADVAARLIEAAEWFLRESVWEDSTQP